MGAFVLKQKVAGEIENKAQVFLFILESIGTPELILIAVIALIVLGPRKLPQMAKTVAKTMAEFRNATNEFKSTWEREVAFEDELKKEPQSYQIEEKSSGSENISGGRELPPNEQDDQSSTAIIIPQIKELSSEDIARNFNLKEVETENSQKNKETAANEKIESGISSKQDWL